MLGEKCPDVSRHSFESVKGLWFEKSLMFSVSSASGTSRHEFALYDAEAASSMSLKTDPRLQVQQKCQPICSQFCLFIGKSL